MSSGEASKSIYPVWPDLTRNAPHGACLRHVTAGPGLKRNVVRFATTRFQQRPRSTVMVRQYPGIGGFQS